MIISNICSVIILLLFFIVQSDGMQNIDQSEEHVIPKEVFSERNLRILEKPFRMSKLNIAWKNAMKFLDNSKLKTFYSDLKDLDDELFDWKGRSYNMDPSNEEREHDKIVYDLVDIMDKYGILTSLGDPFDVPVKGQPEMTEDERELRRKDLEKIRKTQKVDKDTELRRKLVGIMNSYELFQHFGETEKKHYRSPNKEYAFTEEEITNMQFKDLQLKELWDIAQNSGYTDEELKFLKKEFLHYQDKVDLYYKLLEDTGAIEEETERQNAIETYQMEVLNMFPGEVDDEMVLPKKFDKKVFHDNMLVMRNKYAKIKEYYDRLKRMVKVGLHSQEFFEPKALKFWRAATASNFTKNELESIKNELHDYETKLINLRHLQAEHALEIRKYKNRSNLERFADLEESIKKQTRKIEKMQRTIAGRVYRHTEL